MQSQQNPHKILILEDDYLFGKSLIYMLSSIGYYLENIILHDSIQQLTEAAKIITPSVLILDLNVVDSSGEVTFSKAKKLFPDTPIIILSETEDINLSKSLVGKGGQDFIYKSEITTSILSKSIEFSMERSRLTRSLEISEKRYKDIFESSPLPIIILSSELTIKSCNSSFANLYGYNTEYFEGKNLNSLNREIDNWTINENLDSFSKQLIHKNSTDETLYVELTGNKMPCETTDEQTTFVCLLQNRTDEVLFQKSKIKMINEIQEKEKKHLAMELHDNVSQNLVLMNLWLHSLKVCDESVSLKENMQTIINQSITQIRNLSYNLSPPELNEGFIHAIDILISRIQRLHSIKVDFFRPDNISNEEFQNIDTLNLYRIIQEFISNSIKHSNCKSIQIELYFNDKNQLELTLKDDGVGFDITKVSKGLGIKNILQRISDAGLKGDIISRPEHGTKLYLPLKTEIPAIASLS